MPEISRFFGIVIAMFYNDHDPPHFHATITIFALQKKERVKCGHYNIDD